MNAMTHLDAVASMMNGTLYGENAADISMTGVSTDSRRIKPGELFIALRGENFDGHAFIDVVVKEGVSAVVIDELAAKDLPLPACPYIVVDDTRLALGHFAGAWRKRFDIPVIAVTGSNGKTTTKEMIASIMRAALGENVLVTQGNLNNDIGLPLTLLGLNDKHLAAVVEMGMNHPGEIAYLTKMASPTIALVTNVQRAHLEGMGSLEAIAQEKGSIFDGLAENGVAVFSDDDLWTALWKRQSQGKRTLNFSFTHQTNLVARYQGHRLMNDMDLEASGQKISFTLPVPGAHNAFNAVAAAAATLAAGVSLERVAKGLSAFGSVKGRLQQRAGKLGCQIIDDTYNANPDSVKAAIEVLSSLPGRKILILGDMGEIGRQSAQYHDEVGGYAKSQGIDTLFTLGEASARAASNFGQGARHFKKIDEMITAALKELKPETTILVKGSRFMRMERVVDALILHPEGNKHAS